jgi:hypothetical protein
LNASSSKARNASLANATLLAAAFQEGRDTEIPVSMLRAFEASLRAFERHRQLIVDRQKKPERG